MGHICDKISSTIFGIKLLNIERATPAYGGNIYSKSSSLSGFEAVARCSSESVNEVVEMKARIDYLDLKKRDVYVLYSFGDVII